MTICIFCRKEKPYGVPCPRCAGILASLLLALSLLVGCLGDSFLSPANAKAFLQRQGYTNIETTGDRTTFCGEMGPGAVGFRATNPNGIRVSGAVCEGFNSGKVVVLD